MTAAAERRHERLLLALRMVRDEDARSRATLWGLRSTPEYEAAFTEPEPLVSILITTYMNWPLLRDRCLPSVLAQTYERWEAIVVGDAAPDDARKVVESFGDTRIRFVNLPYRGPYPDDPQDAWHSSGTTPWNTAMALSKGSWIGSNSDDDALRPHYVESLLAHAREQRARGRTVTPMSGFPSARGRSSACFLPSLGNGACRLRSCTALFDSSRSSPAIGFRNRERCLAARAHVADRRAVLIPRPAGRRLLPIPVVVGGRTASHPTRVVLSPPEGGPSSRSPTAV